MSSETLLVTGASGHLGRRVVELLLARRPAPAIIAVTRSPEKLADLAARGVAVRAGDFEDPASLPAAFAGATRALVVSTDAIARPGRRIAQHRAAISAALAAGVRHLVYTSLPSPIDSPALIAADHAATEAALADAPIDVTVLRNNLYTDYLVHALPAAIASGQLVDAKGDAGIAYVTREDCARAAAGALADARGRATLDVTGPAAITGDQLAVIASELAGRAIRHVTVSSSALIEGMIAHGIPAPYAALLASFDAAAVRGDYAPVTTTVRDLGGAAPTPVAAFLATQRTQLAA